MLTQSHGQIQQVLMTLMERRSYQVIPLANPVMHEVQQDVVRYVRDAVVGPPYRNPSGTMMLSYAI